MFAGRATMTTCPLASLLNDTATNPTGQRSVQIYGPVPSSVVTYPPRTTSATPPPSRTEPAPYVRMPARGTLGITVRCAQLRR